ncbi:MAG: hypothetical protein WCN98_18435 [Verrucomicrobiaceae bacterium]
MRIPIVFIHKGGGVVFNDAPFNYLNFATLQARLFNPDADIWVIGDSPCLDSLLPFHSHSVDLTLFQDSITEVAGIYKHLSPNNPDIEMFCIARWFVLREWMRQNKIDRCLHLDSDVLLYENAQTLNRTFADCDITLSGGSSPAGSIISLAALDAFCHLVVQSYTTPDKMYELEQIREELISSGQTHGISDMHFMGLLVERDPVRNRPVHAHNSSPSIDTSINSPEEFQMRDDIKRIEFINGLPHAFRTDSAAAHRFALLHFQGNSKGLMQNYLAWPPETPWPGGALVPLVKKHWQSLRDSAVRIRSVSNRNTKLEKRLQAVRKNSQLLRNSLRGLMQSSWIKAGGALRLTCAKETLAECHRLSEEMHENARS